MEQLIITKVEKQKRHTNRYNIFINEEYAFSIHEDLLIKYRLLKGETIDRSRMEKLFEEDERQKAYLTAIRFLSVRSRSIREVKARLKKAGHETELIERIIKRLADEQYLNDAQYAEMMAAERIHVQKKGRVWIKHELKQKGISDQQISETIAGIDQEQEEQEAHALAGKKWSQTSGDQPSRKRKLISFLLRRGYTAGTVQNVLRKLNMDVEDIGFDMTDD